MDSELGRETGCVSPAVGLSELLHSNHPQRQCPPPGVLPPRPPHPAALDARDPRPTKAPQRPSPFLSCAPLSHRHHTMCSQRAGGGSGGPSCM